MGARPSAEQEIEAAARHEKEGVRLRCEREELRKELLAEEAARHQGLERVTHELERASAELKKVNETLLVGGEASPSGRGGDRRSMRKGNHASREHNSRIQGMRANVEAVDDLALRAAHDSELAEAERKQ